MRSDLRALWTSPSRWSRAMLLVAAASLAVHALGLAGVGWRPLAPLAVALHLAVMASIFALVGGAFSRFGRRLRRPAGWMPTVRLSRRLVGLAVALALYALLWFGGFFVAYGEGAPEQRDGGWYWVRHGDAVRVMSADEARWFDARMLSVFSATWAAFALPAAMAHDRRKRRAQAEVAERDDVAA